MEPREFLKMEYRRGAIGALLSDSEKDFSRAVTALAKLFEEDGASLVDAIRFCLQPLPVDARRDGLPCLDCATPQKQMEMLRQANNDVTVRLSCRVSQKKLTATAADITKMMKMFQSDDDAAAEEEAPRKQFVETMIWSAAIKIADVPDPTGGIIGTLWQRGAGEVWASLTGWSPAAPLEGPPPRFIGVVWEQKGTWRGRMGDNGEVVSAKEKGELALQMLERRARNA